MTDIDKIIRERVDGFVAELSELIRQAALERLSEALGSPASAGRKRGGAAPLVALEKRLGKRSKGQKRAPAEMERLLKTIVSTVQAEPGIRADQIAVSLGLATRDTSLPIKKLLADKMLTKKGQKRATQYFPVGEAEAPHMAAPFLLAALDLNDRACVVFGGGQEALTRARTLREHGALVTVVSPEPSTELSSFCSSSGDVSLECREPDASDLDGMWLAVLADQNPVWVDLLGPAALSRRVLFCAVDQPEHNSFAHVGVARAGALQLGISTSGRVPGVAGSLKNLLQRLLDESNFERVVEHVEELRRSSPPTERGSNVRRLAAKIRLEGRLFLED